MNVFSEYPDIREIRLRAGKPVMVRINNINYFICKDKNTKSGLILSDRKNETDDKYVIVNVFTIKEMLQYIWNYSMYAHEEDIRNGFITIKGGHRIGISGKVVMEEGKIKTIKDISCINIRVAHQIKGCARKVMPYIIGEDNASVLHTLIISPPGCGKTTLLRDIIRMLSDGFNSFTGVNVGVVDERSEIGACYMGIEQNDLGVRTDIMDCCPKSLGMLMLVRSMSPSVIAIDEIGSAKDIEALSYIIKSGCACIATVHGSSVDDVKDKPVLGRMIRERIFERYIILGRKQSAGRVEEIFDERGTSLLRCIESC